MAFLGAQEEEDKEEEHPIPAKEPKKVALEPIHGWRIVRHALHAIPILLTFAILSLSFRRVYLCDLGYPGLQSILNAFQYAAKAHELLVNASLSAIVIHRTRQEMSLLNGLPFGLVSAGYQLTDLSYLLSHQFLAAVKLRTGIRKMHHLPFVLLLIVVFALSALVGPSSAIALIPKLAWWTIKDPFSSTGGSTFISLNYSSLYPTDISLGPSDQKRCAANGSETPSGWSTQSTCPSAGYLDIQQWVNTARNQNQAPNITMLETDFGVARYLSAGDTDKFGGYTVASTVTSNSAILLAGLWQYATTEGLETSKLGRPNISPSFADGQPFQKPLVQVQCNTLINGSDGPPTTLEYPYSHIVTPSNQSYSGIWSQPLPAGVLNPVINVTTDGHQLMGFDWVDLTSSAGRPMIGAAFVFSTPSIPVAYLPCTIDAAWAPVKPWLDPKIDRVVLQDSADPLTITRDRNKMANSTQMNLNTEWAQTLNPMGAVSYGQNLYDIDISTIVAIVLKTGFKHADGMWFVDGGGPTSWLFSTILSLQIADGLARMNAYYPIYTCHDNATNSSASFIIDITNIDLGPRPWYPPDEPFAAVARLNTTEYTEVTWRVERLGYGWGLGGTTIKLAMAALLLHVLLVVIHLVNLVIGGWTSTSWANIGEMIALAVDSEPAEKLVNTSAGVEKSATWQEIVKIQEVGEEGLQLVFGNDSQQRLTKRVVIGKKY